MLEESDFTLQPSESETSPKACPQSHDTIVEENNSWECPMCTFVNTDKNRYCEVCSYRYRSTKRKSASFNNHGITTNNKRNTHDNARVTKTIICNDINVNSMSLDCSNLSTSVDTLDLRQVFEEGVGSANIVQVLDKSSKLLAENISSYDTSVNFGGSMDYVVQDVKLEIELTVSSHPVPPAEAQVAAEIRSPNVKKTPSKISYNNTKLKLSSSSSWDCPFCTYKNRAKDKFCSVCGYEKNHNPQQQNKVIQEQAERVQGSRIYSTEESMNLKNMLEIESSRKLFSGESLDDSEAITTASIRSLDDTSFDEGSSIASIGMNQKPREYFDYVPPLKRGMTISWTCKECDKEYNLKDPHCPSCLSLQRPPFYYQPLCIFHKSVEKRKINQEFFEAAMSIEDNEEELTASALVAAANESAKAIMNGESSVLLVNQEADEATKDITVNKSVPTVESWYPYRPPRIGADFQVDLLSLPSCEEFKTFTSPNLVYRDKSSDNKWQKDNECYEILWIQPPEDLFTCIDENNCNEDASELVCESTSSASSSSSQLVTGYSEYFGKFAKSPILALHVLYKENYDIISAVNALSLNSPNDETTTSVEVLNPIMHRRTPRGQIGLDMSVVEMNDDDRNTFRVALIRYGGDNWNKIAKQLSYKYTLGQLQDYFYCVWMNRYRMEYLETERQHRTFIRINAAKKRRKGKFLTKQQHAISKSESMTSIADIPTS